MQSTNTVIISYHGKLNCANLKVLPPFLNFGVLSQVKRPVVDSPTPSRYIGNAGVDNFGWFVCFRKDAVENQQSSLHTAMGYVALLTSLFMHSGGVSNPIYTEQWGK